MKSEEGTNEKKARGGARAGAGAKPMHASGAKVPLGVSRVAPDVAAAVQAAPEGPTAYVEAAIRYYVANH